MKSANTKKITYTALFSAIAAILMYFEFQIPFMPPFLNVDLSGAVILIGAFLFGAAPALMMTFIKDLIHLTSSKTGGVGELADFLILGTMVLIAVLIYSKFHTKKGAVIGCLGGTLGMVLMGVLTNKYLLIPFYSKLMPIEEIINACAAINPAIGSIDSYLIWGVMPFNFIKGIILSTITILLYKKLANFIRTEHFKNKVTNN